MAEVIIGPYWLIFRRERRDSAQKNRFLRNKRHRNGSPQNEWGKIYLSCKEEYSTDSSQEQKIRFEDIYVPHDLVERASRVAQQAMDGILF